ncbi:hypothetical protein B0J15DRAFT_548865 [Fusarium solani]|uniref:Uncharacterized protein n=1 Tax=Fusarium solani TaxID=169388 RepID=A0A9P9HJI0_FUSSL|nr:uncharacterized protein B0J15DRAFT_548865 [Fusarium solani]KAH7258725.1 hypothetical protein B0J15DRAFT_548865 [Fusarium solani]
MSSTVPPKTAFDSALEGATAELVEGLAAEIEQLKAHLGEERHARLQQQERHEQDIKELKDTLGHLHAQMAPLPRASQHPDPIWANCGSLDHKMDHCLHVPEGLHGCILCNNVDHDTDVCALFTAMSFKDQIQLLIYQLGSMPALKTEKPWAKWLGEWSIRPDSRGVDGSFSMPARLPWGQAFTIDLACRPHGHECQALQKECDQHKDTGLLPIDPASVFAGF